MKDKNLYMTTIILFIIGTLLAVLGWVGNRLVNALDKIGSDINEIKNELTKVSTQHDDLEERVGKVERKVYDLNGSQ